MTSKFNPSAKIKKILGNYGTVAYVHRDGIVIIEKRTVKVEKDIYSDIEVWHIVPCEIYIRSYDYKSHETTKVNRLVLHNASLIANGLDEINIALNNNSQSSKENGLAINTSEFRNGLQTWRDTNIVGMFGSDVTIQPNYTEQYSTDGDNSILDYVNSWGNHSVVVHGELPERKETISDNRLLTVN